MTKLLTFLNRSQPICGWTILSLVYIAGIGIMDIFSSYDLDLHCHPMTFIYELDPYCLKTEDIPDMQS